MVETEIGKAIAIAAPTMVLVLAALFSVSYLVSILLGLPPSLGLPPAVRIFGCVMTVVGLAVAGWVFRYRNPADMMVSTYATFMKLFRRAPFARFSGRTEPLVIGGPQKYVRHPLYFGSLSRCSDGHSWGPTPLSLSLASPSCSGSGSS